MNSDLARLLFIVFLFAVSPRDQLNRFRRDLGNLIARRPLECAANLPASKPDPLAHNIIDFVEAMHDGAQGTKALYAATENGRQPYMEYEKYVDRVFDETVSPRK